MKTILPQLPPLVLAACVYTRINGVIRKRYALTTKTETMNPNPRRTAYQED